MQLKPYKRIFREITVNSHQEMNRLVFIQNLGEMSIHRYITGKYNKSAGSKIVHLVTVKDADDTGNFYKDYYYPSPEKSIQGVERHIKKYKKLGWTVERDTGWFSKEEDNRNLISAKFYRETS
jgi:hypothetical protein